MPWRNTVNHWSKQPNAEEVKRRIEEKKKLTHSLMTKEERSKKYYHWKNKPSDEMPNWKGGISYNRGYRFIYQPEHPNANMRGYVLEHRLVIEKSIGRHLDRREVVHHINGDKLDNRLENLKLFSSQGEHFRQSEHKMTRPPKGVLPPHLKQFCFPKGHIPANKAIWTNQNS